MKKYILLGWMILLSVSLIAAQTEEPLPLDASIASFSRAFTISYPASFLEARTTAHAPNNITLTNNADIFTSDGFKLREGVIVLTAAYGNKAMWSMPEGVGVYELAKQFYDTIDTTPASELLPFQLGDLAGYQFNSVIDSSAFYAGNIFLEVAPEQYAGFMLITSLPEELNTFAPTFNAIIGSFRLGVTFDSTAPFATPYTEIFEHEDGFTMPYPKGWRIEGFEMEVNRIVAVTKGQKFDLNMAPSASQPAAIIFHGEMTGVTGDPDHKPDPQNDAALVIQMTLGVPIEQIIRLTIGDYPAALVFRNTPDENTFVVILRDENNFILASIFTGAGEDQDFPAVIVDMLLQATWEGVEAAPTP